MNETFLTVCGTVGTQPRRVVGDGWVITSFRLAHTPRRYDRAAGGWADGDTNWFGVKAFRALANHAAVSLNKGDRVVVHGKLKIDEWRTTEGEVRTSVFIEADTLGHDLVFGTSSFVRATQADRPDAVSQAVADQMLRDDAEDARRGGVAEQHEAAAGDDLDDLEDRSELEAEVGEELREGHQVVTDWVADVG